MSNWIINLVGYSVLQSYFSIVKAANLPCFESINFVDQEGDSDVLSGMLIW